MGTLSQSDDSQRASPEADLAWLDEPVIESPWPLADATYADRDNYGHRHWKFPLLVAPPTGVVDDEAEKEWRRKLQAAEAEIEQGSDW